MFAEVAGDGDIPAETVSMSEACMALASKPSEAGALVGSDSSAIALYGEACGLLGATGLMGSTFAGKDAQLYSE